MLPLSKTCDPADFATLAAELRIVDEHFTKDREQHPMRRWEYALAIHAFDRWRDQQPRSGKQLFAYDIGGAGSPFRYMLGTPVLVVDPLEPAAPNRPPCDLATLVTRYPARFGPAVFCLSVLEHAEDLDQFCYHLSCLVAPGGLLFLTMDACACGDPGQALAHPPAAESHHFHWMRKRIFRREDWIQLADTFTGAVTYAHSGRDFDLLGEVDWAYHGPQVYDYTFAALALVKRP